MEALPPGQMAAAARDQAAAPALAAPTLATRTAARAGTAAPHHRAMAVPMPLVRVPRTVQRRRRRMVFPLRQVPPPTAQLLQAGREVPRVAVRVPAALARAVRAPVALGRAVRAP